jgi:hypothetical protein
MVHDARSERPTTRRAATARAPEGDAKRGGGGLPQKWWQQLLLSSAFLTFATALVTAAPKWFDSGMALIHNTQNRSYIEAQRQAELWKKNFSCVALPQAYSPAADNVKLDATICNSGDIFVSALAGDKPYFYWLPLDRVLGKEKSGSILSSAQAAEAPLGGAQLTRAVMTEAGARAVMQKIQTGPVICKRVLDPRHVLLRISTPQGCLDQIVDTYTGQVVQSKPAPCAPSC